ncbi:capsid scaffolding protein [Trinickia symbiotica]|uniref:Capsid scaffolding protein n=1 Tax=Trinickia symbiotica TaxID=863227 RepID=A0A2T3XSQ4_9BURK|nr:GPO family capsid scaffolding protein [Trinickia symbiotica]PTB19534.1 capsid scaffolding protein [Trinickia symbiotica]
MATNKTKFFRVAVEGATVDGREIKREWLTQMAKNYNPELYGARVNVEHIKGYAPLSASNPFGAYGDVIALKANEIEDGPLKGKMALYAQIDPTEHLVALSKKRQKIYASIEINPTFADIGEAYLVGLAATDDPASLGTEALQFAARHSNNVFSAACETSIELEGEAETSSLLSIVKGMFARNRTTDDQRHADVRRAVEEVADFASKQGRDLATLRVDLARAQQDAADSKKRADEAVAAVEALTAKLSATDNGAPRRPPSTGSTGELVTDC